MVRSQSTAACRVLSVDACQLLLAPCSLFLSYVACGTDWRSVWVELLTRNNLLSAGEVKLRWSDGETSRYTKIILLERVSAAEKATYDSAAGEDRKLARNLPLFVTHGAALTACLCLQAAGLSLEPSRSVKERSVGSRRTQTLTVKSSSCGRAARR